MCIVYHKTYNNCQHIPTAAVYTHKIDKTVKLYYNIKVRRDAKWLNITYLIWTEHCATA